LHSEVGLDGNVYNMQAQAASSSFEPVLSVNCLAAIDLMGGVEQPIDCRIIQNRQAVQSTWSRWIGHWKTSWPTVWPSAPQSQAAEAANLYLCKLEWKCPTPVQRWI